MVLFVCVCTFVNTWGLFRNQNRNNHNNNNNIIIRNLILAVWTRAKAELWGEFDHRICALSENWKGYIWFGSGRVFYLGESCWYTRFSSNSHTQIETHTHKRRTCCANKVWREGGPQEAELHSAEPRKPLRCIDKVEKGATTTTTITTAVNCMCLVCYDVLCVNEEEDQRRIRALNESWEYRFCNCCKFIREENVRISNV